MPNRSGLLGRFLLALRALLAVTALIDLAASRTFIAFSHAWIIATRGRRRDSRRATSPPRRFAYLRGPRSPAPGHGRLCPRRSRWTPDVRDKTRRPTRPAAWRNSR